MTGPDESLTGGVAVQVANVNFVATLGRVQFFWDGTLLSDQSQTPTTTNLAAEVLVTTSPGTHTLSYKVISQTASPLVYSLFAVVQMADTKTGATQEVDVSGNASATTGSMVKYTVVLH